MTSFGLPPEAPSQVYVALGRRGSGKSYGAGVWIEGFLRAGAQVLILDTVGNWYGLQLAADGKTPSDFPIPIIGGMRANLPMPVGAGSAALVARAVVMTGHSTIVDVSMFRRRSLRKWATDFFDELLEAKKENPGPLLVVLEEAHKIAPQDDGAGTQELLEAVEQLPLVGRNFGIGLFMLTQRPQKINKDLLSQAEVWLIFQQIGMHERKYIETTLETKQTRRVANLGKMLPELRIGEAILYSPQWLGVLKKIRLGKKSTYDSTATPVGRPRKIEMPAIAIPDDLRAQLLPVSRGPAPKWNDGPGLDAFLQDVIPDDQVEEALRCLRRRRRLSLV